MSAPPNAFEIARQLYRRRNRERFFYEKVGEYIQEGILISSPSCFIMAKATVLDGKGQAWMVECAVGDLRRLIASIPQPYLPFIAFCRTKSKHKNRLRVYSLSRFIGRARLSALNHQPSHSHGHA